MLSKKYSSSSWKGSRTHTSFQEQIVIMSASVMQGNGTQIHIFHGLLVTGKKDYKKQRG